MRGAMCDLAERTKSDLLRLLGLRDSWKTPLIVNLDYPRANVPDTPLVQLDVSQLGYGLKLQLNLLVTREMKARAVQRELLRAILVEMMYRDRGNIAAGTPYVMPPDWLVEGMLALQPGRDSDNDAELLRTIVASKKISPFEDIVRQRRAQLDAPSRQLHEAYARALVQLLLDVPGGRSKVAQFITDLPDSPNDAVADLRAHFPETLGCAPGKWWALSVAQLSAMDRYETLSAARDRRTARSCSALFHSRTRRAVARLFVRRLRNIFRTAGVPRRAPAGEPSNCCSSVRGHIRPTGRSCRKTTSWPRCLREARRTGCRSGSHGSQIIAP